jgi:hypothetical protein
MNWNDAVPERRVLLGSSSRHVYAERCSEAFPLVELKEYAPGADCGTNLGNDRQGCTGHHPQRRVCQGVNPFCMQILAKQGIEEVISLSQSAGGLDSLRGALWRPEDGKGLSNSSRALGKDPTD